MKSPMPRLIPSLILALCCVFGALSQAAPRAKFPQVECDNPHRFSKAQREHIVYAYNFGAPKGMGYTMAAIAWHESCAGAYMANFSDPSAGLYHAHIPVVLKYYSSYNDTPFTRNVMGQLLIDDREFASKVALDSLLYWHGYHKGNHKNIIKSYNKGFKWEKDRASNKLAESYYHNVRQKIRALESYIPKYSRVKNQSALLEIEQKNKKLLAQRQALQHAKNLRKNTQTPPKPAPAPKSPTQSKQNPTSKSPPARESNAKSQRNATKPSQHNRPQTPQQHTKQPPKPHNYANEFVDLPLEGGLRGRNSSRGNSSDTMGSRGGAIGGSSDRADFDDNFEDFTLIFEGH